MLNIFIVLSLLLTVSCSTNESFKTPKGKELFSSVKLENESPFIRFDYNGGELLKICEAAIDYTKTRLDAVAAVPASERVSSNTLLVLETSLSDFEQVTSPLVFMNSVHPQKPVRDEAKACEEKVNAFLVSTSTRKDLYLAIKDLKIENPQELVLWTEALKGFEQSGLKLPDDQLRQFKKVMEELSQISTKFQSNIAEDNRTVSFTAEELAGAPTDFLERLKKDSSGKFIVTMAYPDFFAVVEHVAVEATRKKMTEAFLSKGLPHNLPLLKRAIELRQQAAQMLGFKTWADYKTAHGRMATSGAMVWDFLNELKDKLKVGARRDLEGMLAYKKTFDPKASRVEYWDTRYLEYQYKKNKLSIDGEYVREFFPSDRVVEKMFDIYSKLLGVRYERVFDARVWHSQVQLYKVIDSKTNKLIAHFYADFIPREGKYNHAAAFQIRSGRRLANGQYLLPVAAIVANFNPPTASKPSLLSHDEVETLFHEFGHIMHQTLTRAPYGSLSGTNVARDFVEAPSQMLEEWVWSPKMLAALSGHYLDAKKKLPEATIKKMLAARDFNQALFYTRQLWLGTVDMTYHSNPPRDIDTTKVQRELYKEIVGIEMPSEGAFEAGFGHLMGYDAGYYGYLWSQVYALDMFTVFSKGGLLSPKVGARYRRHILEPGGMLPEIDMIKNFLNREPSPEPFYRRLGI